MKTTPLRKPRPAHPSRDPYKRRSWETDEDYNDRVAQMNSKSQKDLEKEQQALDSASQWQAEYDKASNVANRQQRDRFIRNKQRQANRLQNVYNDIHKAEQTMRQSKDTVSFDVSTAYKNQELKKQQNDSDKLHDINLMLKSLETAGGIWGIAQFAPYMYLKYCPQALNYIGRQFAKRGLVNQTRQLIAPQINRAIAAQSSMNGNALKFAEVAQDVNQYSGAAIDAAQIYTQPDTKSKLVNSAELVPVVFDKIPNNYARLFSNLGGFAANIYDVYQNLNE